MISTRVIRVFQRVRGIMSWKQLSFVIIISPHSIAFSIGTQRRLLRNCRVRITALTHLMISTHVIRGIQRVHGIMSSESTKAYLDLSRAIY